MLHPLMLGALGAATAWGGALLAHRSLGASFARPGVLRLLSADAFLIEAAAVTVIAPVAGAMLAAGASSPPSQRRAILLAGAAFVGASLATALVASFRTGYPPILVFRGHLTLAIVACALAAFGALVGSFARNALDAAGVALAGSVIAAAALLVGGPATAGLSERAIDAGLLASPPVAIVSAAEIDLLRNAVFYRLSPVSHRHFTYPAWNTSALAYGAFAAGCVGLMTLRNHRQRGF